MAGSERLVHDLYEEKNCSWSIRIIQKNGLMQLPLLIMSFHSRFHGEIVLLCMSFWKTYFDLPYQ